MSCRLDIHEALIEKVGSEINNILIEKRNTYTFTSPSFIQINSVRDDSDSKIKSLSFSGYQAVNVAKELQKRIIDKIDKNYKGHVFFVLENIKDFSKPVGIQIRINKDYVDYLYDQQPDEEKTDPADILDKQNYFEELEIIDEERNNTEYFEEEKPLNGQFTLFNAADSTIDGKDEMIKQKYFPNSNENTSTDVLQKIALSDHPLAPVAGNLLQFDPKVSIELVEGEDLGDFVDDSGQARKSAASYLNNKIKIARDVNFKGLGSEPTLIHEIVHAMTHEYIKNNPNSEEVKALKEIYKHALTLKKNMSTDAYPFTNLDKFIVAVFTNASTIKFLLGQPSISKSEPNFLADIFKAIMNLFKLDSSNKTLFNDAFIAATNIIIAQDAANKRNQEGTFFISDDGTLFSPTSETGDNVFNQEEFNNQVKYRLKATEILLSDKADEIFRKGDKNNWDIDKILQELAVPKEQKELIKSFNTRNREEIITNLLANYSYTIEINTAKELNAPSNYIEDQIEYYENQIKYADKFYVTYEREGKFIVFNNDYNIERGNSYGSRDINSPKFNTREEAEIYRKELVNQKIKDDTKNLEDVKKVDIKEENTQHYSNLSVPGGTNYTENEISTPNITPSIKGHAQFATDQGIGWFRSDDKAIYTGINKVQDALDDNNNPKFINEDGSEDIATKTRRILEVQSDLFQKGRDKESLTDRGSFGYEDFNTKGLHYYQIKTLGKISYHNSKGKITEEEYKNAYETIGKDKENQFLQLLNKDSNWVTFFVKSIIQDSAKKGYEKVLFPTGNTASKVESHTTLEAFKKQKEDRIKELESIILNKSELLTEFEKNDDVYLNYHGFKSEYNFVRVRQNFWNKKYDTGDKRTLSEDSYDGYIIQEYTNGKPDKITKITKDKALELIKKSDEGIYDENLEKNKSEITQLKQELERVETEGFGALKPIYNFYENTVTNILNKIYGKENVKVITDEYGNTWNEIAITPKVLSEILLQLEGVNQTEASPETVAKLTELLESLNIPVEQMDELFAQLGVNGLADGVNRLIQIAKGKESVALAEETMHMLTLMAPAEMMDTLMENITDYKIYKEVYERYKGHPAYQNEDGSPNERMIKLEAVGKLLAEYYIMNAENLSPEEVNVAKTIWGALKDWIKNVFGARVDSFQDFINKVNSGKYFSENMQTRDERLLQVAFTKEDSSDMADGLIAGLSTMSSYEKAQKQFKKDSRINMAPEVRAMMALENAISIFTEKDLPEINNLQSFIHLPKKRAFATSKFKLTEANKKIDAIDDASYFKQFKDKAMQSLEYIRNMDTVADNLSDRVISIKKSIKDNINYDRDGYPALDPDDRMRMHYEMEMIQSTMEIYKNELEQLASLFEDLGEGNPVSEMIKEINGKFSNALVDTTNILKGNLRETLAKFIEPQVEQYKKLQNKELIEFQKQLNKVDQEIAKQKAKGKSTKSLEKDKAAIEDKMEIVQENIDNPPLSVNNLMDILENSEGARTIDKLSITRILEAGRTNKNQVVLAIATLLSNATLDSHKAAETSQGVLRTIFNKFKRAQNIKGNAFDDVVDQVVRYKFNEKTGELEEYDDRVLTKSVKQWLFEDDLEVLKYLYHRAETNAADIDEIVKEYKKYMGEDLTTAEKLNLVDTFKNKHNDLIKNFGKTKYNDAYNQVQRILDDAILSTGQTVREYRRAFVDRLTDASDIINDVMSDEVALEIALEDKADVIKELQQLESIFDYNTGQDKTGDALLVAETILKWKKAKKKVEVAPGVFESIDQYYTTYTAELEWKQQKDELETAIADAQISYAASPTQANKDALANIENTYSLWRKMNVSMQAPEQFYVDRAQIIEAIQSIIETTKIYSKAEEAFEYEYDLAWQTLSSLTKGSRDDNGVIEGSGLMAASDRIKAAEQEIEKLRSTIKSLRRRMTESDYKDMNDLIDKLDNMQESSLTDYWDKLFISKFNNEKAIMISNGMDSPTSAEVTDSLMQTQFFKDNTLDVTDKYSQTDDNNLPKDVIRYYKSLGNGRMVVKTVRPIYIWRQSLPKGQYAKEDQMSFNLKNYKVNPIFENPEHETMDGKISLDPSKVIPNGITPSRYENKKYAALKQDQIDFLDEVRAFYYADQMKKSRKDRLGDSLPRISAVKAGRKMQLLNPRNWKFKKTFSKEAISDRLFGNTATKMETEYAESRAKNANKRVFAKYTHGTTTHSTQEKDLFKLLAMYNAEVHRAEKINEYVPALNTASKIAADKKFSASLEYQINYGLNKTSKKAILGKKVDAFTDSVRSTKGFFRLGFPWQTGSVIKNTATGSFAIWSNSAKLRQYSEGMFTKAYAKAIPFAAQLVAERFVATPSKKTAILRRLNVVSGYDINDAVGNNADILLKTANGLGYAMGAIRAASETHLDLTMYELYRSGNPIIVNGQAIDIEDMYDYDNGVLTPKPGLTSEMENMLTNSVEEMKSYTQGNFASNNVSLIQQTFVGRSILFMRKHIYNPLMRRIGSKRHTGTGHEIEGYYRVIGAMLSSSWTNKNIGYLTNRSNEEKIAVNALLKDVVATSIIGGALYFIEKAFKEGEGDDEEDWLAWYTLLIFRKVVSEISFLNPVEKVATVYHVLTTAGYNKQSGNPINSAMMYAVMNPAKELAYTMITPIDVNQLQFKEKFDSTDPYYKQFNNQVYLYNFLRTISWKNDYQNAKSSLKSYEWYNPSGFQFSGEDEFVKNGKSGSKKKSNAGL